MNDRTDPGYHRWQLDLFRNLGLIPVWEIRYAQNSITGAEDHDLQDLYDRGATASVAALFMTRVHGWRVESAPGLSRR